jgi:isopentenyl phosphate kinase
MRRPVVFSPFFSHMKLPRENIRNMKFGLSRSYCGSSHISNETVHPYCYEDIQFAKENKITLVSADDICPYDTLSDKLRFKQRAVAKIQFSEEKKQLMNMHSNFRTVKFKGQLLAEMVKG